MVEKPGASPASRALLDVVDRLSAEFPEVPLSVIHQKIGEARPVAVRHLPDVDRYQETLELEATIRLRLGGTNGRGSSTPELDR
jgi:hypothetical protein